MASRRRYGVTVNYEQTVIDQLVCEEVQQFSRAKRTFMISDRRVRHVSNLFCRAKCGSQIPHHLVRDDSKLWTFHLCMPFARGEAARNEYSTMSLNYGPFMDVRALRKVNTNHMPKATLTLLCTTARWQLM